MDKKIRVLNCYDIFVGSALIPKISHLVNTEKYSGIIIITDSVVEKHCFPEFKKSFPKVEKIVISPGERAKNIETVKKIWQKIATNCNQKSNPSAKRITFLISKNICRKSEIE